MPNPQAPMPRRSGWTAGLAALVAAPVLALSAQAVEPALRQPCAQPGVPDQARSPAVQPGQPPLRDTVADRLMVQAGPDGEIAPYPEPEDVNDVDTDPPDAAALQLDPAMPPQVLAGLLTQAMRQGHVVVLLLPKS